MAGAPLPLAGADVATLLLKLNLKGKIQAATAWCDKTGAAGVADISGEYVEQFLDALDLKAFEKDRLLEKLRAASTAQVGTASAGNGGAPFFLASAPVSELGRAKDLVLAHGGQYAAGDADDIFNSMTLKDQESVMLGNNVDMTCHMPHELFFFRLCWL